jgi:hypothetical protein
MGWTKADEIKFGGGMGGYAAKRDLEYQVSWREKLEKSRCDVKIDINGQSYEVHEEVAEQFSKFIRRANVQKERIAELEKLNMSFAMKEYERRSNAIGAPRPRET